MSGHSIDDIAVGLRTQFTKTVSESDVYLFAGITGDLDPNHVDEEYCRKTSLGHRVAHGALIVGYTSAASTRILQDFERPMVSVGYDRIRFLKPVYFGDTLTIDYEIASIERERQRTVAKIEVRNQRGELVMVATHIMQLIT
jgi:3-hydroxybutyryl-CoA dehydratase